MTDEIFISEKTGKPLDCKEHPEFPGYYICSNGDIWSTNARKGTQTIKLKPGKDKDGYLHVCLFNKVGSKTIRVHRLVLEMFIGQKPQGNYDGSHINGDRTDNSLQNLRWLPHKENIDEKQIHGTQCRGELVGGSKLKAFEVKAIKDLLAIGFTRKEISAQFGVSFGAIHSISIGKTWKHI